MSKKYIIFTDLNGTLLDHNTYSFHKAAEALEHCCDVHVPIIFNTSKTYAQTLPITQQLDNSHPFVVENGAAIYLPKDYFTHLNPDLLNAVDVGAYWLVRYGKRQLDIINQLTTLSTEFKFEPASTLTEEDIAIRAHLPLLQARHVKQRQFSELIIWNDTDEKLIQFRQTLADLGLSCLNDGVFFYICGQHDKSATVKLLRKLYDENHHCQHTVVALGDGNNDVPMFNHADIAIIVDSPINKNLRLDNHPNSSRARFPGPTGWNDAVLNLFGLKTADCLE